MGIQIDSKHQMFTHVITLCQEEWITEFLEKICFVIWFELCA